MKLTGRLVIGCLALASLIAAEDGWIKYGKQRDIIVYGGSYYHFLARDADPKAIYVRPAATNRTEVLWKGNAPVSDIALSSSGVLVAFREQIANRNVPKDKSNYVERQYSSEGNLVESYEYHNSILRVVALDRRPLESVDEAQRFAWSPSSDQIVYISGRYREGGVGFTTTGTWLLDLSSNRRERIFAEGYDVTWPEFDGQIYIRHATASGVSVVKYNIARQSIEETPYNGIHFSPDGEYYYAPNYHVSPFRLFRRADNEDITKKSAFLASPGLEYAQPQAWVDKTTLVLRSSTPGEDVEFFYDVRQGLAKSVSGHLIGVDGQEKLLVFFGGELKRLSRDQLRPVQLPKER